MIKFDEDPFLQAAEILVRADETERALAVLENLPAYYRDNVPEKIRKLKALIKRKITLPYDLLHDSRELIKSDDWSVQYLNGTMRGVMLKNIVKTYNDQKITPHIVDMGPGDFTFAIGLHSEGLHFSYECFTLNDQAKVEIKQKLGNKYSGQITGNPIIFVAFEIIEHLSNVKEIRTCYERISYMGNIPKFIMLSTPKYTFAHGTQDWRFDGIHHLRAYTPFEFSQVCQELFPEYSMSYADNEVMVIQGLLKT